MNQNKLEPYEMFPFVNIWCASPISIARWRDSLAPCTHLLAWPIAESANVWTDMHAPWSYGQMEIQQYMQYIIHTALAILHKDVHYNVATLEDFILYQIENKNKNDIQHQIIYNAIIVKKQTYNCFSN